jgi:prophage regulatory protein
VGRSRMRQLIRYPTFPEPFQRLHGTTVWLKSEVEAWIRENRPPRPDATDDA